MNLQISRSRMLAVAGATLALTARDAAAQPAVAVRLVGVPTDDMAAVVYARQNGMYRKAGLEIELVPGTTGDASTLAVLAGTYELGKGSVIASLLAHVRSLPLVIIANGVVWDPKRPVSLAVVAADSPIRSAPDLNGKTGSTTALRDIVTLSFSAWCDQNGGDSRTLHWTEIPNSAKAAAIIDHRIDFCSLNEPQLTDALSGGKIRVLAPTMNVFGEHCVVTVYFAHAAWAARHPEAVRAFARVTYEAAGYVNAHPAQTAPLMAEFTKISLETLRKIARAPAATSGDPAQVQSIIDLAVKYQMLPHGFPAREAYAPA